MHVSIIIVIYVFDASGTCTCICVHDVCVCCYIVQCTLLRTSYSRGGYVCIHAYHYVAMYKLVLIQKRIAIFRIRIIAKSNHRYSTIYGQMNNQILLINYSLMIKRDFYSKIPTYPHCLV